MQSKIIKMYKAVKIDGVWGIQNTAIDDPEYSFRPLGSTTAWEILCRRTCHKWNEEIEQCLNEETEPAGSHYS